MLTIRPVGASPLALGSPRRTLEDLRRMESKSTRKSPSHASERKQGEDKSDGNALLDLESSKARRDAADVAAALSHTVHSGLEYMDDVMANELLASAAVKSGSEFEELVLGPGLRLLRYKSSAASAPSPHLESKFDDDTIDACNAPHTPASGGSPSTPSRWSPVALLSYVLRKDAPEAIAMLTELNNTLISSHQSSSSELTADVLNGVCDCLLKFVGGWIESSQSGKEAVEGDQLFPIALVTLVNALFALPARAADLLGLLRSLRALPSLSLLSVPINPLALRCGVMCMRCSVPSVLLLLFVVSAAPPHKRRALRVDCVSLSVSRVTHSLSPSLWSHHSMEHRHRHLIVDCDVCTAVVISS